LSSSSPVYAAGLRKGYVFCLTVSVLSCAGGVRWGPVWSRWGPVGSGVVRWGPVGYLVKPVCAAFRRNKE